MSSVILDVLRCAAIAGGALGLGRWLGGRAVFSKTWFWPLIVAPLFTPNLLISYAWARFAYELGAWPVAAFAFYSIVLTLKLVPISALARHWFPSPLSAQGAFCRDLVHPGSRWERRKFALQAEGAKPWIVFALLFLIAFPEFELASLWSLKTWPVALFDAHVGGLILSESLRLALPSALIQLSVLGVLLWQTRRTIPRLEPGSDHPGARSVDAPRGPLIFGGISAMLLTFWPLGFVTYQAVNGFGTLSRNSVFPRDLLASLGFAIATAILAWLASGFGVRRKSGVIFSTALPGLLGALVVALLTLALFQIPLLREIYDTPLPLLFALMVIVWPGALLLRWLITAHRPAESAHLARLSGSRRMRWELAGRPRFTAIALLACWTWFDFTASSILAPLGLTPVFVRLHHLAHYGRTSALSALLFTATIAPILVLSLTLGVARLYARRNARR